MGIKNVFLTHVLTNQIMINHYNRTKKLTGQSEETSQESSHEHLNN